ncbi:MAG: preprotein translocase subunit SecG [Saprospiraceae bacterium]
MTNAFTILIAINCILLMAIILIQNPKGGGIDSTLGGSAANQMFGASKSIDFVEKVTWGLAASLFILCIITAMMVSGSGSSDLITPIQ